MVGSWTCWKRYLGQLGRSQLAVFIRTLQAEQRRAWKATPVRRKVLARASPRGNNRQDRMCGAVCGGCCRRARLAPRDSEPFEVKQETVTDENGHHLRPTEEPRVRQKPGVGTNSEGSRFTDPYRLSADRIGTDRLPFKSPSKKISGHM